MTKKRYTKDSTRAHIGDIAEKTGVSMATVSRVIHGHKDVSETTRDKVLQCINELGYVPQRNGRNTTIRLGLSVPMFNDYFGLIMEGAYEALQGRDAQFVTARTDNRYDLETYQVQQLVRQHVHGLLLVLPQESPEELLRLRQQGIPFVVTDPFVALPDEIPTVMVENISASMLAMEHLLSLGHHRIAVITGPPHWGMTIDRVAGYYAALASAGLPINPHLIREGRWTPESGVEVTEQLLDLPEPPSAIFALNDDMAIGAMHAIQKRGLHVPDDLSVVGCDDVSLNLPFLTPPLTTARHPLKEIGRLAVDVLYRLLQQQPLEATHIKLSARLVVRDSTGPCKEGK